MQKIKLSFVFLMILLCFWACKKSAQSDNQSIYGPLTSNVWSIKGGPIYDSNGVQFKSNGETYSKNLDVTAGKWVLLGDTIKFTFATSTYEKDFHYIGILSGDKTSILGIVYLGDDINDKSFPTASFQGYADGAISNTSNMDIENAIAILNANALPGSVARCAYHVRLALEAGDIDTKLHPVLGKDYGPFLQSKGFVMLTTNVNDGTYQPKPGDVAVFDGFTGHESGHIQMFNGSSWVSDFKQLYFTPGPSYRSPPDSYVIYRSQPIKLLLHSELYNFNETR